MGWKDSWSIVGPSFTKWTTHAANLSGTFADVAANNAAAYQDGSAARAGRNTGGPIIQHGTRASTAFMHDKCVKQHVFPKRKFVSLHGDLDFSNNPKSICQTMTAAEAEVEGWWETSKLLVHKAMKMKRNNVIKTMRTIVRGKARSGL